MIPVKVVDLEYQTIADLWLREKPAIGEMLDIAVGDGGPRTAWRVVDVQHKVTAGWMTLRPPQHALVAYVEPSEPLQS